MTKRRVTAFILAIIMTLPFIPVEVMAEEVATARTIEILEITGEVVTTRGTPRENRASVGMNLHNGHTASTGTDSSCTLTFDDGSLLTMDQRSKIQISQASRTRLSVNVASGGLLVDAVTQQDNNSVSVRVGNTSLTIRGTFFLAENRDDGVAVYTMFEGWGEVDGIILPPLHILRVHENIADDNEISTDVDRTFELIPFYLSEETSLFALSVILADTDRFIALGVISEDEIPIIEDLVTDRTEEMEEAENQLASVAGGLIRFFNILRGISSTGSGDGSGDGGSSGGVDNGPGNVVTINRAPLTEAITRASNLMSPINTLVRSSALSARVDEMWAAQAHFDDLSAAVATASGLLDATITFNELNTAVAELNTATDQFDANRRPGLIPNDGEVFSPLLMLGALPVNATFSPHIESAHGIMLGAFNELENFIAANGELNIPNFIDATPMMAMFSAFSSPEEEFEFLLAAFKEAEALFNAVLDIALEFSFSFAAGVASDDVVINALMNEIRNIIYNTSLFTITIFDLPGLEEAVQNALNDPEFGSNSNTFIPDIDIDGDANESLAAANEVVRGIVIAQRSDDVDRGRYWVTREVMTNFTSAAIRANSELTSETGRVRDAFEAMRSARYAAETAATAFDNALTNALSTVENWQSANEQQLLDAIEVALEESNANAEINRIIANADSQVRAIISAIDPQIIANLTTANALVAERANMLVGIRTQANASQQRIARELNQSIAAFEREIRPGTRAVSVYKGALTRAIRNAHETRSMITVGVGAYGALRGQRFVTLAQWNAFESAITEAETIWRDVNSTTQQVANIAAALSAATNLFLGQIAEGQQPPENTGLVVAIGSAFNFIGGTIIAENSETVLYGTRWVPAASADTFAGGDAPWGIPFDPSDLANITINPNSELGVALYMFDRIAIDNTITQTVADDAEIRLTTAQIRTYNSGGRGTRVDLFPGEDGTKVWRLERGGSPLGYFTNIHNAQVHAIDGDTLVLVGEETITEFHLIFRYIHMIIAEGATLTIRANLFSFGFYRLSNFGIIDILPNGGLWVFPDTRLDNHSTINIHNNGTLRVDHDNPILQPMQGIPQVSIWRDLGVDPIPAAMHPSQEILGGVLPRKGVLTNHSGATINNAASSTFIIFDPRDRWLPTEGDFQRGLIVQGAVENQGTIIGQVLLDSVDTMHGPNNPRAGEGRQINRLWMRPVNIGHGSISGNGNHGNVRDLTNLQQASIEGAIAEWDLGDLLDSLPEAEGDTIISNVLMQFFALLGQLESARTLRNNQAASADAISAGADGLRAAVAGIAAGIPTTQNRARLRTALQDAAQVRDLLEAAPSTSMITSAILNLNLEMGLAITHYGNQFATDGSINFRSDALLAETNRAYNALDPLQVDRTQLYEARVFAVLVEVQFLDWTLVTDLTQHLQQADIFSGVQGNARSVYQNPLATQQEIDSANESLRRHIRIAQAFLIPASPIAALLEILDIAPGVYQTARAYPNLAPEEILLVNDLGNAIDNAWVVFFNLTAPDTQISTANSTLRDAVRAVEDALDPGPPTGGQLDRTALQEALLIADDVLALLEDVMGEPGVFPAFLNLSAESQDAQQAYNTATTQQAIDEANTALRNEIDSAAALIGIDVQLIGPDGRVALEDLIAHAIDMLPQADFFIAMLLGTAIELAEEALDNAVIQARIDAAFDILLQILTANDLAPEPPDDGQLDTVALEELIEFARDVLPLLLMLDMMFAFGMIEIQLGLAEYALANATTQLEIDEAYRDLLDRLDAFDVAPTSDTMPTIFLPEAPVAIEPPEAPSDDYEQDDDEANDDENETDEDDYEYDDSAIKEDEGDDDLPPADDDSDDDDLPPADDDSDDDDLPPADDDSDNDNDNDGEYGSSEPDDVYDYDYDTEEYQYPDTTP